MRKTLFLILIGICLLMYSCTKVIHHASTEVQVYQMEDGSSSSPNIHSLIQPYKETLDKEMNQIIGSCTERMEKEQPESTLGNWMADVLYETAQSNFEVNIDFAIQNYGGIRIPYLPKGDISKGKIFELMPFENRVVILQLKGVVLDTFFHHIAALGGWPISKNVSFQIQNGKAQNILIHQKPLDKNRIYTIAMPDYIANGGDKCSFFAQYENRIDSELLIRDLLIEYIHDNPNIVAKLEKRITIIK